MYLKYTRGSENEQIVGRNHSNIDHFRRVGFRALSDADFDGYRVGEG